MVVGRDLSTKYYYCRMKNYKIVFIKFDEIILIGFVIDIKLMRFAWNVLSSRLLFVRLLWALNCWDRMIGVQNVSKYITTFRNKMW